MRALWRRAPGTVSDVRDAVNDEQNSALAYTTVMTVLTRLYDKGFVARQRRGRSYAYEPVYSETELVDVLGRRDVDRLVERYGDAALAYFVETLQDADPDLLRRMQSLASGEGAESTDETTGPARR